jgi:hypothetical protein
MNGVLPACLVNDALCRWRMTRNIGNGQIISPEMAP